MAVKCEYHDNFLTAQAAAAGALDREAQPCLFDRLDWLESLHRIALRDKTPALLQACGGDAQGWLPLMQAESGHLVALANWYNFTWRPIFANAESEVERMALLRLLAKQAKSHTRRFTLSPVPDEEGSASALEAAFRTAGWSVFREICDQNHILEVKGRSFDAYWETRPSRLKNTVKRKGKTGVVTIRIDSEYEPESWRDYERVYARSWKPEEGSPEFLRQIAERESVAGALRLGLAYIDGQPVAAQFWTVEEGAAFIHKLAHVEDQVNASPGTLLSHALFRHVIERDGVTRIDFGTGDDRYKRDWMNRRDPLWRFAMYNPARIGAWPGLVRGWVRAATRKGSQ